MKENWFGRLAAAGLIRKPRPNVNLVEQVDVYGYLTLKTIRASTGEVVQVSEGKNIVTNGGRTALSHLFAGDDVANKQIVNIEFGDGTGVVDITDVALFGASIIVKPVTPSFPATTQVTFTGTVDQFEGNGGGSQVYQEAALRTGDNTFATHRTFGSVTKDNTLVLLATWSFVF